MPLQPDGRIRSKDIGTGEVNSRVIDNLRSSNYDGDPESPDVDSGSQGWLILKNGKVVFNEGTFRGDVAIAGNLEVSGTDGILVFDGGDITVNSGGDIIINGGQLTAGPTTVDASGLTVGNAPVVIDADGLDIGTGLVQIDGDGITIEDGDGNVIFRRTTTAPWRPTRSLFPWPDASETTTSSSYDILWRSGISEVWEEGVYIVVVARCDSGTTYDLQFGAAREGDVTPTDSEVITGLTNTSASTFSRKFAITYDVSDPKGSFRSFSIAARRTGGSGTIYVTNHFVWRVGTLSDLGSEIG